MGIIEGEFRLQATPTQIIFELQANNNNKVSLYIDLDRENNIVHVEGYKMVSGRVEVDGPDGTVESLRWLVSASKQEETPG